MAPESMSLTTKVESGSPYQLDQSQTLKASTALLKHISSTTEEKDAISTSKDLLASDSSDPTDVEPIWLILTTKKHIIPQPRLKPGKIPLPHSLNTSPTSTICLITPDPQRAFKDAIAHPSFPISLSRRIARTIDIKKLEKKYHSFESKRQLRDSYDMFLADDRIITYLPKILGKVFYATTPKRPIPVRLEAPKEKSEKKNAALPSSKTRKTPSDTKSIAPTAMIAREIERTLSMAQVNLAPSITTSVRVGLASFTAEQLSANIDAVVAGLLEKFVTKKWRGVRSIHIKGPNTMALPIWLADELWDDEGMVLEDREVEEREAKKAVKGKRKRKMLEGGAAGGEEEQQQQKKKRKNEDGEGKGEEVEKKKKKRRDGEDGMSVEMKERREKLRKQKEEVRATIGGGVAAEKKPEIGGVVVDGKKAVKVKKSKKVVVEVNL